MSDYRRLISYIYEYEGETKGKNIGFAKLEARNGQCRIHVSTKRVYVGGNATGVYLLKKDGSELPIGNIFVRNGTGEFRITVDAGNVEGSGVSLEDVYGLTVHDVKNAWRSYKTVWEDVSPEQSEPVIQAAEVAETAEVVEVTEIVEAAEQEDESEGSIESMVISPELENPEVIRYLTETEETATEQGDLWEVMRKQCPKIQPFDYEGRSEILTIRPDDIGKLPRENWVYGNNSFLLHGYYNFRYLILVKLEPENAMVRYLLGVPGHYYSSEKYMATMFGFPNFVLSKKQPPNDDRFGYWYTDIKI